MIDAKQMTRGLGGAVLTCVALALSATTLPAQFSLSTVVSLAQRNSTQVRIAEADVQKAAATLNESHLIYVPNLVLGSSIGPPSIGFPTGQPSIANATLQSLVFNMSQFKYIKAARVGYDAAQKALKNAREQVALDAATNYIELDTVMHELDVVNKQAEFADRLVKIEQERAEGGIDSLSQLLDAKLTAAEIKLRRIHLEARTHTLAEQLAIATGLPANTIQTVSSSVPEIPTIRADQKPIINTGIEAARLQARTKQMMAQGDRLHTYFPQISFAAQYNRDAISLNNYSFFYSHAKSDNFSAGIQVQLPIFDLADRARAHASAAEALRAKVEAEEVEHRNDLAIATLTGNLRELDAQAEVASLKQQIATEQLRTVQTEQSLGNGSSSSQQSSPKTEQLALIDERQKYEDSLEAGIDLAKARLNLLEALGHMEDWLKLLNTDQKNSETASQIQSTH